MRHKGHVLEISSNNPKFPDLLEAWRNRGLLWMFVLRNIKARYQQTLLGASWAVIQPLILAGLLTVFVGMLLGAPSNGLPYVLFAFSGTAIWNVFQRVVNDTSTSFAGNGGLILKVYFPRILIPLSSALTALADLVPVFILLVGTVSTYGRFSGIHLLATPFFVLLAVLLAFSIGLWITMFDALYRDLRPLIPSVLQALLFLSPVMYASSAVPAKWQSVYELNPLVAILQGFRWSVVSGIDGPSLTSVLSASGISLALLLGGLHVFARLEQSAVDRL